MVAIIACNWYAQNIFMCVGAIFFRENINASFCPSLSEPFDYTLDVALSIEGLRCKIV